MANDNTDIDETLDEAGFSNGDWFDRNTIAVVLTPHVATVFPDAESANQALRILIQAAQMPPQSTPRLILEMDPMDLEDDIPDEIDFRGAVWGKHARWFPEGSALVVLEADVARFFPGAKAVHEALRILIQAGQHAVEQAMIP